MRASTFFALFIAVLLGFAAVAAARYFGWFQSRPVPQVVTAPKVELPKVLVAKKNLYEGMAMTALDVQVRELRPDELDDFNKNAAKYLPPTVEAAVLRVPTANIGAGHVLLKEHLEPQGIPEGLPPRITPGMRSIHVSIPKERAGGGLIRVGDHVDVLLTTAISGDKNGPPITYKTATIARNLRVLLKRDMLWPLLAPVPENKPMQFELEANPYRAALIEFARDKGQLTLVPTPTPPLAKGTELKKPATFSEAGSKEYGNEDERIANVLKNDRAIGDADLERIFGLVPLPVSEAVRVELLNGNKIKEVSQFTRPVNLAERRRVDPDQPGYGYRFSAVPVATTEPAAPFARPITKQK